MNPMYIGLGIVTVVMLIAFIFLASKKPVRAAVKQAVSSQPGFVPSQEQLVVNLVAPAFEDARDKRLKKVTYDAMLEKWEELTYGAGGQAPAPKAPAAK